MTRAALLFIWRHCGAFDGKPPVGVTVFVEGDEEVGSAGLTQLLEAIAPNLQPTFSSFSTPATGQSDSLPSPPPFADLPPARGGSARWTMPCIPGCTAEWSRMH